MKSLSKSRSVVVYFCWSTQIQTSITGSSFFSSVLTQHHYNKMQKIMQNHRSFSRLCCEPLQILHDMWCFVRLSDIHKTFTYYVLVQCSQPMWYFTEFLSAHYLGTHHKMWWWRESFPPFGGFIRVNFYVLHQKLWKHHS